MVGLGGGARAVLVVDGGGGGGGGGGGIEAEIVEFVGDVVGRRWHGHYGGGERIEELNYEGEWRKGF